MESFKIDNFAKDNPSKKFPAFNSLTPDEAQKIYKKLSEEIGKTVSPDNLVRIINELETSVKDVNANKEGFLLENIFGDINIFPSEKVYINWYRFDDIDEMHFVDLNNYFDDIWYPSSDDIDIFDATFSWLLSIAHDGNVKYLILTRSNALSENAHSARKCKEDG